MTQTTGTVEVRMDLFPADVVVSVNGQDGQKIYNPSRLLVGRDEVWVWFMSPDGRAELVYNERIESLEGRRTIGWDAEMGDGSHLHFNRSSGCGCGNPLRGFHPPFATVQVDSL